MLLGIGHWAYWREHREASAGGDALGSALSDEARGTIKSAEARPEEGTKREHTTRPQE